MPYSMPVAMYKQHPIARIRPLFDRVKVERLFAHRKRQVNANQLQRLLAK